MSRRGPRGLTPEEQTLWDKVAKRTQPMHAARRKSIDASLPKPKTVEPPAELPHFRIGEARTDTAVPHNLAPPLSDAVSAQPVAMDRKRHKRMQRGKLDPEAKIDLHGRTLDQAHGALNRFILDAHASGKRLVLVITGKGKPRDQDGPIPVRRGVLKHQVPEWLQAPALRHAVLQVTQAHMRHGGSGAYYVYLRRNR